MPVTANTGQNADAATTNAAVASVNSTRGTYGLSQDAPATASGKDYLATLIGTLKTKLNEANTNYRNTSQADLSGIIQPPAGAGIFGAILVLIDQKAAAIRSTYCSCQCNYCTCECDYCSCDNYCTCNCAYSCPCQCNYSCTCNCNQPCWCEIATQHTCLAPGEVIYTSKGPRKVEEIEEGDYVLNAQGEYERIISLWKMPNVRNKLVTYSGPSIDLTVTDDHPILVLDTAEDKIIRADAYRIMADTGRYKALVPRFKKDRARFDDNDTFYFKGDIPITTVIIPLLPAILRGEDIPIRIDHPVPNEAILKAIGGRGILPSWVFDYNDESLFEVLRAFKDGGTVSYGLAHQLRMIAIQLGLNSKVLRKSGQAETYWIFVRHPKLQRWGDYFLLDIDKVQFHESNEDVYNLVTAHSNTYVSEIALGDGFTSDVD